MIRIIKEEQLSEPRTNYTDALFREHMQKYNEKVYNISEDVDDIYELFFEQHVEAFQATGKTPPKMVYGTMFSDELNSEHCRLADEMNPIVITCAGNMGNAYIPSKQSITVSFNPRALDELSKIATYSDLVQKKLRSEITADSIKASIVHELSHWIRDSLNDSYIYNLLTFTKDLDRNDPKQLKKLQGIWGRRKSINASHFEIDAQVHAISQIKSHYDSAEWESKTLEDLFFSYPTLMEIGRILYKNFSFRAYEKWMQDLIKRMARENLLGNSMVDFPSVTLFEHTGGIAI